MEWLVARKKRKSGRKNMRLSCGEELVTLGPQLRLKKNTFQGLVLPLSDVSQASSVLAKVKQVPRLRKFQHFPHALRVRRSSSSNGNGPEEREELQCKTSYRASEDSGVYETWGDDGEGGVGDRLLHLLQRWQVENVVVLVARQDDSLCGRLIGAELFKLNVEAAKLALEQYYFENIKPSDAAKMELMEAAPKSTPGGPYQPLSARSQQENDGESASSSSQPTASVCLMTSETIPSWPIKHQPTSDGGGRKGVRQGRINHFLNRRSSGFKSKFKATPNPEGQTHNSLSIGRNQHELEVGDENADVTHASGGIEWLGISRDELLKLKSIRVPVKELHYLFMCIVILLEKPPEGRKIRAKPTPKQEEELTPTNFSWMRCRETLHQSYYWSERLRGLHGSKLMKSQVTALRALFQEPFFNENAFIRISVASVKIFAWLQRLLDEYDDMELGLRDRQGPPGADIEAEIEVRTQTLSSPPKSPKLQPRPPPPAQHEKEEQQLAREFYMHGFASTANSSSSSRAPHAVKIVDKGRLFNHASR